jgi:hypothetical protein
MTSSVTASIAASLPASFVAEVLTRCGRRVVDRRLFAAGPDRNLEWQVERRQRRALQR